MRRGQYKVIKYASDITAQVIARKRSEYLGGLLKSVAAGAEQLNASVREISHSMIKSKEVRAYVTSTAAAVEQQTVVASDMSASMQRAAIEANSIGH